MRRVVLVTARWGDSQSEAGAVVRLVAGALSTCARVEVVSLRSSDDSRDSSRATPPASTRRDSVFFLHELAATRAEREHAGVLRAALALKSPSRLPGISGPRLAELYGGRAEIAGELIASLRPDAVLLAGPETWWLPDLVRTVTPGARIVSLPLFGDDPVGDLVPFAPLVTAVDAVGVLSRAEGGRVVERIQAHAGPARSARPEVAELEVAFAVNRPAAAQVMVGMSQFGRFVVLLTGFPEGTPGARRSPGHDYVREALGPIAVAEVAHDRWRISDTERQREVPVGPSRPNLWKLLSTPRSASTCARRGSSAGRPWSRSSSARRSSCPRAPSPPSTPRDRTAACGTGTTASSSTPPEPSSTARLCGRACLRRDGSGRSGCTETTKDSPSRWRDLSSGEKSSRRR